MSAHEPESVQVSQAPLRMVVAEEVRALMGRRRVNGVQLARHIGRSHTYVWRRLAGETSFDLDDLERIAAFLEVDLLEMLPSSSTPRIRYTSRYIAPAERPADTRPNGHPGRTTLRRTRRIDTLPPVTEDGLSVTDD